MKRLALALTAMGLSAGAFAAYPANTDPTLISVPQLAGGFFIGGTALYLQASDSHGDLDYAVVNSGTTSPFASSVKNVDPGYDWGWGINVGYIFPNTGNDVNLSYFSFSTDDTSSDFVSQAIANIDPFNVDDNELENPNYATAKAEYDLDQVDLTAGQYIDVGCRLILHPNVGLRWAQLERKLNSFYAEPPADDNDQLGLQEKSDFSGIGPLVGLDASYYIGMGFGAVAHVDSAILVGNIDSSLNATHVENPTPVFYTSVLNADDTNRVVPVMDAKLGADYTYVFNNSSNSDLTVEAGWQFSKYFDAVDRLYGTIGTTGEGTTPSSISNRVTSSVGLEGPYVSLTYHV